MSEEGLCPYKLCVKFLRYILCKVEESLWGSIHTDTQRCQPRYQHEKDDRVLLAFLQQIVEGHETTSHDLPSEKIQETVRAPSTRIFTLYRERGLPRWVFEAPSR